MHHYWYAKVGEFDNKAFNDIAAAIHFSAYVNRLRLQRADDLHRQQPDATIADIIARSGFDSPSNYYKAKRKYGEC